MKEEKTIFKPLVGIEPHIFGLLVRRVNHYTTRTNHTGNAASWMDPCSYLIHYINCSQLDGSL